MIEQREHHLISLVIDGEATEHEWRELESIADSDPRVWRELAQSQRDHAGLSTALADAGAIADGMIFPPRTLAQQHGDLSTSAHRLRFNSLAGWTGWAVAALVAITAASRMGVPSAPSTNTSNKAGLADLSTFSSAAEAFQAYLDKGQQSGSVLGEMPTKVLVETRPAATGHGYEVLYVRQVLERMVVPDLYQIEGQNELGHPTLVRYEHPVRSSM